MFAAALLAAYCACFVWIGVQIGDLVRDPRVLWLAIFGSGAMGATAILFWRLSR